MCDVQQHGGPDDEGFYISENNRMVLGHRRLSLIDLSSAGHQPMAWENRYQIVYNGELYNYQELKSELVALGCHFQNQSDTEVILAAYATWGRSAFSRFNGMFAFAIWDDVAHQIHLVRDVTGIKPLYFSLHEGGLAFASEIRALQVIPYLQEENRQWKIYMMAYGHLPEPVTQLKQVSPLPKGSYLTYHVPSGTVTQKTYGYFSYVEKIQDRSSAIALVKTLLTASIKRHLIADAPVGVFLSGGLDSSIISIIADQLHPELDSISIHFNEAEYSEKKYQDIVQQQLRGKHHQYQLTEEAFTSSLPTILNTMDSPSCDGINTWFISKYARENGLKAVLSGIGGDELFGGYPSFKRIEAANLLQQFPDPVLRAGQMSNSKSLRRLSYLSMKGIAGMYLFLRGQFIPREIAHFLGMNEAEVWNILQDMPDNPQLKLLSVENQASWLEWNLYMQNQLLRDADVMSMAHGVEIRVPFLDKEFVSACLQMTTKVKYSGALPKQLLIDAFKDQLPNEVWNRPKMGFSFPFKEWLMNNEFLQSGFSGNNSIYQKQFENGQLHWSQYLTLFLTQNNGHA